MAWKSLLSAAVGALIGFGYYRFVGCRSGACMITGNPIVATLYGGAMGFMVAGGVG
jgi:hypothetical protein